MTERQSIEEDVQQKVIRINNNIDGLEKHLTIQIEKCNREIERMKVDLTESIEQKLFEL